MEKLLREEDTEAAKDPKKGEAGSLEKNVPDVPDWSSTLHKSSQGLESASGHSLTSPCPFTGARVS